MNERCRLYLITPPQLELDSFTYSFAQALGAGDVASVQLRLKDVSDDEIRTSAKALMPIAHGHNVAFLINDRPDLAVECGADGVHIGQDDTSYEEARGALGPNRIVGVTCHNSLHLASNAAEAGADYVAFGAFFPTATKVAKTHAEIELLEWWRDLIVIPCVAIGGITVENCALLVRAGADFLAVSEGIWAHPGGPEVAVAEFNEQIDSVTF